MKSPRIYVACLAAYNAGRLHGAWIDLEGKDADDIMDEILNMLASSPEPSAEEYAVHDYDDMIDLGEHPSLEDVAAFAELIAEHGMDLVKGIADAIGAGADDISKALKERYLGAYDSLEAWAEEYLGDTGMLDDVPAALRSYIDVAAYARDVKLSGDISTIEAGGQIHVFTTR